MLHFDDPLVTPLDLFTPHYYFLNCTRINAPTKRGIPLCFHFNIIPNKIHSFSKNTTISNEAISILTAFETSQIIILLRWYYQLAHKYHDFVVNKSLLMEQDTLIVTQNIYIGLETDSNEGRRAVDSIQLCEE